MLKRRRSRPRPQPDRSLTLTPILLDCPECQHRTYADYNNYRTISTLDSVFRLTLTIRRCPNLECSRFLRPYRPEAESHFALPYHEFGLDVMALVGRLRYAEHRSIPEIYRELTRRGIVLAERTVTNLLDRYDELRALATADPRRLEPLLRPQGRVILAIDGLQPDVGHEVLWIFRDCLSGEILLAKSLLLSTAPDLAGLIDQVAGPCRCRSPVWSPMARRASARRWPRPLTVSLISSAISTISARRPNRSMRRIATPRRN